MATALKKFETFITDAQRQTSAYTTFQNSLSQLSTDFFYQVYSIDSGGNDIGGLIIHGLITPAQASAALALLTSLNTALGVTVPCITYDVTSEP